MTKDELLDKAVNFLEMLGYGLISIRFSRLLILKIFRPERDLNVKSIYYE